MEGATVLVRYVFAVIGAAELGGGLYAFFAGYTKREPGAPVPTRNKMVGVFAMVTGLFFLYAALPR
jgi:hypothetical protein